MTDPLWQPSPADIANTNMDAFRKALEERSGEMISSYSDLHNFSVNNMEAFWDAFWEFAGIRASVKGDRVLIDVDKMPGAQFFPDARLNFAENLLRRRDDGDALVFWAEDKVRRKLSWGDLYDLVSRLAQAMRDEGIKPGDRVAGFVPNMPETIAAMLAATSIGAIWTSCSPDFGARGVVDRFGQTEPVMLFAANGYYYNGKEIDSISRIAEFLPDLPSVQKVVIMPLTSNAADLSPIENAVHLDAFVAPYGPGDIAFEQLPFNHPLYIMYSSGTTGVPKCIVHGAGGTLLNQVKEHLLHSNVKRDDRVFYFTTCGWMMWNWLVAGLAAEATLLLYDGSPFAPDGNILFDYADAEGMTLFGTSAKWIDACNKAGLVPRETHSLATVRLMASTGSPLVPESFDYVYNSVKPDLQLASISGGTDIVGCFMLGNPTVPVWRGEIQSLGLGMDVQVMDDDGNPVRGEKGELVCAKPFPCMPVMFWNDEDGARYKGAYFEKFDNIWCHGDFVELTAHDGIVVYGRSDATLNPGGVRIGTAEIYRQVETFDEVLEAIVIGQDWQGDVRVVLFVRMAEDVELTDDLIKQIKTRVRQNCTPRHVPAKVVAVADIPRTKSGKITELAVRDIVHGRAVKNQEALANPEALDLYQDILVLSEA